MVPSLRVTCLSPGLAPQKSAAGPVSATGGVTRWASGFLGVGHRGRRSQPGSPRAPLRLWAGCGGPSRAAASHSLGPLAAAQWAGRSRGLDAGLRREQGALGGPRSCGRAGTSWSAGQARSCGSVVSAIITGASRGTLVDSRWFFPGPQPGTGLSLRPGLRPLLRGDGGGQPVLCWATWLGALGSCAGGAALSSGFGRRWLLFSRTLTRTALSWSRVQVLGCTSLGPSPVDAVSSGSDRTESPGVGHHDPRSLRFPGVAPGNSVHLSPCPLHGSKCVIASRDIADCFLVSVYIVNVGSRGAQQEGGQDPGKRKPLAGSRRGRCCPLTWAPAHVCHLWPFILSQPGGQRQEALHSEAAGEASPSPWQDSRWRFKAEVTQM